MKNSHPDISFVLPFYRERSAELQKTLQMIAEQDAWLPSYEVIFSQNGGLTKRKVTGKQATLVYTKKKGLGVGVRNGIKHARGRWVYVTSPDMPFEFSDLKNMLQLLDYDLLLGSKLHKDTAYLAPARRRLVSKLQSRVLHLIFSDYPVRDASGSILGRREKIAALAQKARADDYFYLPEFVYRAYKAGLSLIEVPVQYRKYASDSTIHIVSDGIRYVKRIGQLWWEMKRYKNV